MYWEAKSVNPELPLPVWTSTPAARGAEPLMTSHLQEEGLGQLTWALSNPSRLPVPPVGAELWCGRDPGGGVQNSAHFHEGWFDQEPHKSKVT